MPETAKWTRIPADYTDAEQDMRSIISNLALRGLEVRAVKEKVGNRFKRYVEYRTASEE